MRLFEESDNLKNGDKILITWLQPCINGGGGRNPYIGMSGVVCDLNEDEGYFHLFTGSSWLCGVQTGWYNLRFIRL
jgi:hypothetical protein